MAINPLNNQQLLLPAPAAGSASAPAPAPTAEPSAPVPSESVTLGAAPAAEQPKPQHVIDGPVQPLAEPLAPKKWTVMLFSASDNNLYRFLQADIDEAERIGSTDKMNIIVQTDHAPVGGGGKIYELQKDNTPQLKSPVRADLGPVNMGDPKALSEFIQWTQKNYPAENYMLIMSDHGGAQQGASEDESHHGWMTPQDIQAGLADARAKTGKKIDVLGFDACLMANAEVAQQLKDEANFLVGSEEVEGGAGWQYDQTLVSSRKTNRLFTPEILEAADTAMRSRVDFEPKEFASKIVEMSKGRQGDLPTMTAFDNSKVQGITDAAKKFGEALLASNITPADLKAAKRETVGFHMNKDLGDFAAKVAGKATADDKLKEAAAELRTAIEAAVVAEQHSTKYAGATGIQVELNNTKGPEATVATPPNMTPERAKELKLGGSYADLDFVKQTNWQAVQSKINQKVPGEVESPFGEGGGLGGLSPENIEAILGALLGALASAAEQAGSGAAPASAPAPAPTPEEVAAMLSYVQSLDLPAPPSAESK